METDQTGGAGRIFRLIKMKEKKQNRILLQFSFWKRAQVCTGQVVQVETVIFPDVPYSRNDALESYPGNEKLKRKN